MPEPIVTSNEESLRSDLREPVRKTVEDTLNGLLEAEADDLVGAGRHGRTAEREAYRAGRYDRGPTTSSGEVAIHMPKLKGARLATAAIERHRRRESSVEEAMIEMHLAGVSTRRIEDVSEILWGSGVSAATVPDLDGKAFAPVEGWRNRPPGRACPYACVDGIYLKRSRGGACENVAVMVAIGVDDDGYREGRPRRLRRDLNLHRVPSGTLGPHPHRQRHRAAEPRGPQADARGGCLPGREVGAHARHREAQARRGERVGHEALPGRDAVGGVAVPEAGLWAVGKCARILTVPSSHLTQIPLTFALGLSRKGSSESR